MGNRSFAKRREERIERLRMRTFFLAERIRQHPDQERRHDKAERSALLWALEEIERLNRIEDALDEPDVSEGARLEAIEAICASRYRPTDDDLARTPALAREYAPSPPEA